MIRVALVDLGMGNLRSVERALAQAATDARVACAVTRTPDPDEVRRADKIVVPGQGAFRDLAARLDAGMGDALRERIGAGVPFFGICLGLQALFEGSDEAPDARGLGVFEGRVTKLAPSEGIKVPHMGWNTVTLRPPHGASGPLATLAVGDGGERWFYFVHSYHASPRDPSVVAAVTRHGPHEVTAAVARDNVIATQFHPEKSQRDGLEMLGAFLAGR